MSQSKKPRVAVTKDSRGHIHIRLNAGLKATLGRGAVKAKDCGCKGSKDALASGTNLAAIKNRAREQSKKGFVQHVNKNYPGVFVIEDWYDSGKTVASYENGREL